jgi:hypothetical protein
MAGSNIKVVDYSKLKIYYRKTTVPPYFVSKPGQVGVAVLGSSPNQDTRYPD